MKSETRTQVYTAAGRKFKEGVAAWASHTSAACAHVTYRQAHGLPTHRIRDLLRHFLAPILEEEAMQSWRSFARPSSTCRASLP